MSLVTGILISFSWFTKFHGRKIPMKINDKNEYTVVGFISSYRM